MVCAHVRRENPRALAQTMLYLTCSMIFRVDPAHNGVSCAKDWVSVDCGTKHVYLLSVSFYRGLNYLPFCQRYVKHHRTINVLVKLKTVLKKSLRLTDIG